MHNITATYTDQYQLAMAEVYFLAGKKDDKAVFDYFFRKAPFKGSYVVFAGLANVLEILENLKFDKKDISFLSKQGMHPDFLEYLKNFSFNGKIHSAREGDIVFPTEPILTMEANIIEAQLSETLLLNFLNFQTLIATKASRVRNVAEERYLIDFGLRRAQATGAYYASRAAFIGGFDATSNVRAGRDFNIPVSGTMAHAFIQSYDDELTAFREFSENNPKNCVLLVDTYDTLRSGVPNAIIVGKEMEKRNQKLIGIRLDSGDLAYLSKKARKMLDDAGLDYVKIAASNQLEEKLIKSLKEQKAKIDIFLTAQSSSFIAVINAGMASATSFLPSSALLCKFQAALDGVFKLAFFQKKPRIKLSDSFAKITLPGKKQVLRIIKPDGSFYGADIIACKEESSEIEKMHHPFEALKTMNTKGLLQEKVLHKVMEDGKRIQPEQSLEDIAKFTKTQLSRLPHEYKRFQYPHIYKIGLSDKLNNKRNELIKKHKKN